MKTEQISVTINGIRTTIIRRDDQNGIRICTTAADGQMILSDLSQREISGKGQIHKAIEKIAGYSYGIREIDNAGTDDEIIVAKCNFNQYEEIRKIVMMFRD